MTLCALTLCVLVGCSAQNARAPSPAAGAAPAEHWPIAYAQDFAAAAGAQAFAFSDPTRWRWSAAPDAPGLELLGKSRYQPPVRSPTSIALLADFEFADFDLECELLQTGPEYGHRDLCLFFGWQSPQQFYYVHLASTPDANAHNVFCVDAAPRTNLAPVAARGIEWGQEVWHHVRIERRVDPGTIAVFWDRSPTPILTATDTRFGWGRIGLGSFDDSGRFAQLRVRAPAARTPKGAHTPRAALFGN